METRQDGKRLSQTLKEAVAKVVYEYGKPQHLGDQALLGMSDCLFPHYPPTDQERNAASVLREWLTASEVGDSVREHLNQLVEAVELPARAYRDAMHYWEHMAYERRERWGHPEMRPSDLFKDLSRRLAQGDPEAMLEFMAMARGEWPFGAAPPAVALPPELVTRVLEEAARVRDELSPLVTNVARARQCLSDYVWQVVKSESIEPIKA
jgi:tRNA nucleotidyltransferase/poly(A) polymerase